MNPSLSHLSDTKASSTAPAINPRGSSRLKAVLLLLLVFVLGAACGIGGGLIVLRRLAQQAINAPNTKNAPINVAMRLLEDDLAGHVELSDKEKAMLNFELSECGTAFKDLRMEIWQKARTKATESLERIASQLPPDKAAKLRERAKSRLQPWGLLE